MLFNICDPSISVESQISLALQILCGFTVEEIANALLTHTETIKKRLLRAKNKLREHHFQIKTVSPADIQARLETVLRCLYLFFNEGYFSETNNQFMVVYRSQKARNPGTPCRESHPDAAGPLN